MRAPLAKPVCRIALVAIGVMCSMSIGVRSGPQIGIQGGPPRFAFERLAFAPSELVGVAETGRARVDV